MILVTGATGFVGRHVVDRLAAAGREVRAMVRDQTRYSPPIGVEVTEADLTKPATLAGAVTGVGAIIHCAAITANIQEPYRDAYMDINGGGTQALVHAAEEAGVSRLVVMSGMATQPAPAGTYMATRWALEEAVRSSAIPYAILQPSVQFGDGAEFIAALARLLRRSPIVPAIGGGGTRFQPIWIEDVVTCVERCLADEALLGHEHPIGGSEYATFTEVVRTISQVLHKRRLIAPLPMGIARIQASLMSAVLPNSPLTPATLELFGLDNATDIDAVEKTFGFRPRGFREHLLAHGIDA